jgi:hypothetical protein
MISSADVANEKPDAVHNAAHIVTAIKTAVFPHLYVIFCLISVGAASEPRYDGFAACCATFRRRRNQSAKRYYQYIKQRHRCKSYRTRTDYVILK